jgi:hypothetical protein
MVKVSELVLLLITAWTLEPAWGQDLKLNGNCVKAYHLTTAEIKTKFPYNKTTSINLVSFKAVNSPDTPDSLRHYGLPKKGSQLDTALLFEKVILNARQEAVLLDILMNYDYDPKEEEIMQMISFEYHPQHAILFFNQRHEVIGYIEICFECARIQVTPDDLELSNFCTDKYSMLMDFFRASGISWKTAR